MGVEPLDFLKLLFQSLFFRLFTGNTVVKSSGFQSIEQGIGWDFIRTVRVQVGVDSVGIQLAFCTMAEEKLHHFHAFCVCGGYMQNALLVCGGGIDPGS